MVLTFDRSSRDQRHLSSQIVPISCHFGFIASYRQAYFCFVLKFPVMNPATYQLENIDNIPPGMLVDADIKASLGKLFSENASPERAKYSTYEILLDEGYELIDHSEAGEIHRIERRAVDGSIAIAPGETALVYSLEKFCLPSTMYARVNTVGQIFLAGFSAENTYVDPGFHGQISITLINNTNRILCLSVGTPLARIEFIKLSKQPDKIHPGRGGVRKSKVHLQIDHEVTAVYRKLDLAELIKAVEKNTTLDTIPRKSIRSDIAIIRAYEEFAAQLEKSRSEVERLDCALDSQKKFMKSVNNIASVGLATACALWLDKLGLVNWFISSVFPSFTDSGKPTYWLNIVVNISCSVVATPIFAKFLSVYQDASRKAK